MTVLSSDIKNKIRNYTLPKNVVEEMNLPYPIIGTGTGRIVLEYDNETVLKVSPSKMGDHQNQTEYTVYQNASSSAKEHLAPAIQLADDNSWLLMKKVTNPIETYGAFETEDEEKVKQRLEACGVYLNEVEVGYYNGSLVAYDYGNCEGY